MAGKKLTVVISQSQGKNPIKRQLEEEIAAALLMDPDVDVSLVPHLYDMSADHTGMLFLRSVPGDMVVLAWLYPRGTQWVLDRQGVKGREGVSLIRSEEEDEDEPEPEPDAEESAGVGPRDVPNRTIYCIDLRASTDPQVYLDEIGRIAAEKSVQTVDLLGWIGGNPKQEQLQRYLQPERMLTAIRDDAAEDSDALPEPTKRRWYPVIDYSRCTNCMECIDFCLFGVYGVDQQDMILVEQQDNCKKGCPACSRVCPANAIIFPGHKEPGIAGANGEVAGLKIDLSKLFGGPSPTDDPLTIAARERDIELLRDGREAVGMAVGIPKRQPNQRNAPRDELDDLMDGLDALDL
ncbi:MAG: ATP-binding protein [Planctomycetaceae bacterium]